MPLQRHRSGFSAVNLGSEYTPEEVEFLREIDHYKRVMRRPHPTWMEVLNVLRSLGWRKQEKAKEGSHV